MRTNRFWIIAAAGAVLAFTAITTMAQTLPASDATKRVDAILSKMTLEEKIDYIGGTGFGIRAMPGLKLPAFEMSDGPIGVRSNLKFPSTTYAAGIGLAATWDREMAERVGNGIGTDARARGVHFMLGPGMNIYRSPRNGRNFEYFGEDPFLAASIAVGYVNGIQKNGVSATPKHFLANNSEFDRHNVDSVVDERTLREIYLPTFEAVVKQAHAGALMDSYNLINGVHATQNGYFNTDIARGDWHFDGVMMSDWVATYDGVAAANGGLDLEMPTGAFMNRANLLPAMKDGRVKEATIDEKIRRILMTAARFGWLDRDQLDQSLSNINQANRQTALDAARESIVLLKNAGGVLPLDRSKVKSVLVVGPNAYPGALVAGGSGGVNPFSSVSPLEGIAQLLGPNVAVHYERGLPTLPDAAARTPFMTAAENGKPGVTMEVFQNVNLQGVPASTSVLKTINQKGFGWDQLFGVDFGDREALFKANKTESRRYTGYFIAPQTGSYQISVIGAIEGSGYRVFVDDKVVFDDWAISKSIEAGAVLALSAGPHKVVAEDFQAGLFGGRMRLAIADTSQIVAASAKSLAAKADAVIVVAGFDDANEGEGADRAFELPFGQEELIRQMAALNKKTVVALTSGGGVATSGWLDQVPAYVQTWYGGEQGGTALAEVLFGDVNPSGHLPITIEKRAEDNPAFANYYPAPGSKKTEYKEGVFVGYRGYEHNHVEPQFAFGFGLSYTSFRIAKLKIEKINAPKAIMMHGLPALYTVSFDVTNTGSRGGDEVVQLYVGQQNASIPRPEKELKGFARVSLKPKETKRVSLTLDARAFTYYDVAGKHWHADAGTYIISVGDSSVSIAQKDEVKTAALDVGNDQ